MKVWKLALAAVVLLNSSNIYQAKALTTANVEFTQEKSLFLSRNDSQLIIKQPTIIAQSKTYVSPQGDYKILMPGSEITKEGNTISSASTRTKTGYAVSYEDMPEESWSLYGEGIYQLLEDYLPDAVADNGKIVEMSRLDFDGHVGIQVIVEHTDKTIGKYRGFIFQGRVYSLAAVTSGKFTAETDSFFNSFKIVGPIR